LRKNWSDGPAKTAQEKILKNHLVVLGCLRGAGVTLAEVIGQYHARGVVPLRLCEMTAGPAPLDGDCDRAVALVTA
jgi:hypothetical protein